MGTAMVWKGVKEIGCGINPTGWNGMPMYVCEYRGTKTLSCDTPNMGGCYNNNVAQSTTTTTALSAIPPSLDAVPVVQLASQSEINQWLSATNADRAKHGAAPVTWSNELATYAQNWANRGQFAHSNCYGNVKAGENLAAGYRTIAQAVAGWYGEVKDCIWPGCQSGKGGAAVGHFTAMVWKGVKEIGCGINPTGWNGMPMYVCEYRG